MARLPEFQLSTSIKLRCSTTHSVDAAKADKQ